MQVIDNFISPFYFKELQSLILGSKFDWYYNDFITSKGDSTFQFTHMLYNHKMDRPDRFFKSLEHCFSGLKMKRIHRIKVNLRPRDVSNRRSGYHVDGLPCSTTAILYMNTNNGWTDFKKGGRVKSVANRVVIFDSNLEHRGVSCTDEDKRVVINFNYEV